MLIPMCKVPTIPPATSGWYLFSSKNGYIRAAMLVMPDGVGDMCAETSSGERWYWPHNDNPAGDFVGGTWFYMSSASLELSI